MMAVLVAVGCLPLMVTVKHVNTGVANLFRVFGISTVGENHHFMIG